MLPRLLTLVWFAFSSVFLSKAQDQGKFIPPGAVHLTQRQDHHKGLPVARKDTLPCFCSVAPRIVAIAAQGSLRTYQGLPQAACMPVNTTPGAAAASAYLPAGLDTCGVASVRYAWSIAAGDSIAAVSGSSTGSTVQVSLSGPGTYTLRLENTVTCSDGSSCSSFSYYTDSSGVDSVHCTCTAGPVTIRPVNRQGNRWTYQGSAAGTCTGHYGRAPRLTPCAVQSTRYQWSIAGGVAAIEGSSTGPTVTVAIHANGPFSLRLEGTTACNDGQTCTNYNFYADTARVPVPKSCSCSIDVDCARTADAGGLRTYSGILKGGCTGEYGSAAPYLPCAVQNVTWSWQVSEGGQVAEIVGPADQQQVSVRIRASGTYTLRVQADVVCSDGSKNCGGFNFDYCMDTADVEKKCGFLYTESHLPEMKGGLSPAVKKTVRVRRDEFVALFAEAKDFDKVAIECTPSYACDAARTPSRREVLLAGKPGFEWEIESGEGNFVKLGFLPAEAQSAAGDHVIFQPPYVPWPGPGQAPITKTTVIRLRVVDASGAGALLDQPVYDLITITTTRSRSAEPDHYTVRIRNTPWTVPAVVLQNHNKGPCKAAYGWEKTNDLKKPAIKLPAVADNDKMVLGQWMVLEADNQEETDELKMVCTAADCAEDGGKKAYPDGMEWEWSIKNDDGKKGHFVGSKKGRFVVYAAPDSLPLSAAGGMVVELEVRVSNTGVQINDLPQTSNPVSIKIYRPGVQLAYPPLDWLPLEDNNITLQSSLLYHDNGTWKPALAHMGRIHFFELLGVSREKGVCMNDPTPDKAHTCRDLLLQEGAATEVFERPGDPGPFLCEGNRYYLHARSQKPARAQTITVYSEDFGAYGMLRSFANINGGGRDSIRGERPVYVPVPVPAIEVQHPLGRAKRHLYTDNRVTVPRDVDENRIADGGWRTQGGAAISDPANPRDDNDNQLPGDGYPGDGLSNYQEYRGFFSMGNFIRTSNRNKDLFIHNPDALPLAGFRAALSDPGGVGRVSVHQVTAAEYRDNRTREVNFNYNPQLHYLPVLFEPLRVQKGLRLISRPPERGDLASFLGFTYPVEARFLAVQTPPNWVLSVVVYPLNVRRHALRVGVRPDDLLAVTVAHELGHAISMYHHGEDYVMNGLQSGHMDCFMRYSNVAPDNFPEPLGTLFCNHANATGNNLLVPCAVPVCYGAPARGRGDCLHQFRISCRTIFFPVR